MHFQDKENSNIDLNTLSDIERKQPTLYYSEIGQYLEDIRLNKTSKSNEGILGKIFFNKGKSLKATVKVILDDITIRKTIHSDLLKKIDDSILKERSILSHSEGLNMQYIFDRFVENNKLQQKTKNNIFELEKEKRNEQLECWRDLMFLKKYLLSALREYWDLTQRKNLLFSDLHTLVENE